MNGFFIHVWCELGLFTCEALGVGGRKGTYSSQSSCEERVYSNALLIVRLHGRELAGVGYWFGACVCIVGHNVLFLSANEILIE